MVCGAPPSLDIVKEPRLDHHWCIVFTLPPASIISARDNLVERGLVLPRCSNCFDQRPNFAKEISGDMAIIPGDVIIFFQVWICPIARRLCYVLHTDIDNVGEAGYLGVLSVNGDIRTINRFQGC